MNNYRIPERPLEPPPEKPLPDVPCPVCGSYDAEDFYFTKDGECVGCDMCIEIKDYWDVAEQIYHEQF